MRTHFITCLQIIKVNDFYLKIRVGDTEYFVPADELYLGLLAVLISGQPENVELLASSSTENGARSPGRAVESVVEEPKEES